MPKTLTKNQHRLPLLYSFIFCFFSPHHGNDTSRENGNILERENLVDPKQCSTHCHHNQLGISSSNKRSFLVTFKNEISQLAIYNIIHFKKRLSSINLRLAYNQLLSPIEKKLIVGIVPRRTKSFFLIHSELEIFQVLMFLLL